MTGQKALIVGGTSGIGWALAGLLAQDGWAVETVGLPASGPSGLPSGVRAVHHLDMTRQPEALTALAGIVREMGGVDLFVISLGILHFNEELDWEWERRTIEVNVAGFAAAANVGMRFFLERGRGHLVGISSIAALFGHRAAPAYSASKAFIASYLACLRQNAGYLGLPITVTEIRPGFVDTPLLPPGGWRPWVVPVDEAARQIRRAIREKRERAYITRRWRLGAWAVRLLPRFLLNRLR